MKLKQLLAIIIALFCQLTVAMAQNTTITGNVVDATGEPLIGANVLIKGSSTGTITDFDGNFTLDVPANAVLQFSFIGYKNQEVKVGSQKHIVVTLEDDSELLEDIVVVGYGTTKRSDISGSISSVKTDELQKTATASVGTMLRGKASGLQITQNSASPGGSLDIQIRGGLSGTSPLVVIDGVPQVKFASTSSGTSYSGGEKENVLMGLNPSDIESIDILKDASAAAIYGSDAAGGVILITTKRGKEGTVDIQFNNSVTMQYISDMPNFMNAKDFMTEQNKVFAELGQASSQRYSQEKINNFVGNGTNWVDEVTRMGLVNDHNLSLTAGTDKTKLLASLSYYHHNGVAKNNSMQRFTGRVNFDQQIGKYVKTGIYTSFAQIKYQDVPLGNSRNENSALIYSAMTFNPTVPVYAADGSYSDNPDRNIYPNPVSLLDIDDQTKNTNFFASAYIEVKPIKELTIRWTAGLDNKKVAFSQYIPTTTKKGYSLNGQASRQNSDDMMLSTNATVSYNKVFAQKHDFGAMVGFEYKKQSWSGDGIVASNFPYDGALSNNLSASEQENPTITSYKGSSEMASFMGRLNYSYDNRYIATFNFRVDGSSNFAEKHQYGFFPGGSIAWRISEEEFFESLSWWNNLKLRLGAGQTGNAGSLTGVNSYYSVWNNVYAFGGSMANGIALTNLGNPNLKWETLTDYNIGIDFGFLRNRIAGTIDLYLRERSDVIMEKSLMSYQQIKSIDYNSAAVYQARGIDFNITTINFDKKNFGWTTDLNLSVYQNRTVKRDADFLPAVYQDYVEDWGDIYGYVSDGLIQQGEYVPHMPNAQAGSIKYLDIDGYVYDDNGNKMRDSEGRYIKSGTPDGILDEADYVKLGNNTPIPFSINNTFRIKNWDINIYLYGSLRGCKINDVLYQSATGITDLTSGLNAIEDVKDRWSPENPNGTLPGVYNSLSGVDASSGDFFYENSWYLRLDNISLGYTIPIKPNKVCKNIHAYIAARNLYVFTPYKGMDPETGNGIGAYPNQRSFAIGIDFKF